MTEEHVRQLVRALRDIAQTLAKADPRLKARLYEELGVELTSTRTDASSASQRVRVLQNVSEGHTP